MFDPIANHGQPIVDGLDVVHVLSHFGCRLTGAVDRLAGGLDNINLRAVTTRGVVVIRKYCSANFDRAEIDLKFARYLANRGYPTPDPMTTINGTPLLEYRGRPVALFPFIPGIVPESNSGELARQTGGLLGQMHLLGQDWRGRLPMIDRLSSLEGVAEQSSSLSGWAEWQSIVNAFLARHGDELKSILPMLPTGPIHHDAHHKNVIVQDGVVIALLDFGEINLAALVIDLLRLCLYFATEGKDHRLPQDLAAAAFDGYRAVRELTHCERHALNTLFDLVNLCDAADFLRSPPKGVASVYQCQSLQVYLANSGFHFQAILVRDSTRF